MNRSKTPRRSPLPALGIGLLLVLGALAGATAYTGSQTVQTQQDLASTLKAQVNATGYARVTGSSYQRGFLSSTQKLNVVLGKEGQAGALPMIITNRIQHGPLPGLKAVGNALIDTQIKFADPVLQQKVDQALGNQQPTIRTVVGLNGSTNTHIEVPKGQYSEDGSAITWQPLKGDVNNSGLKSSSNINWPEFKVTSSEGNLTFSGLSVSGSSQKQTAQDLFGTGSQAMTLANMSYSATGGTSKTAASNLQLSNFKISSDTKLSGEFYDGSVRYDIGKLAVTPLSGAVQNYDDVQLHLSLNHLSRAPLTRISTTINALNEQTRAKPEQSPDLTDAQRKALMDDVLALFKAQPVLSIDRLSLTQPSGQLVLTGKAQIPDATQLSGENAQMLMLAPSMARGLLKLEAEFKAPEAALRELLGNISPEASSGIDSMIDAGMLKRQGNQLTSEMLFSEGKGTVNGQALGGGF